ncbi:MAG: cadherin-like domain-containing protein, partial [bacterium]
MWSASGAIADVNTLLAGLTFTPALNYNSDFAIATSVSDGLAPALTGTKNMTGTAVNDAPETVNLSADETYTEDTALDLTDIVVSDVDNTDVTVTLTLSDPLAGSLNTGTSNLVASVYDSGTGVWTASGAIADVNVLLAGLTFAPALNYNSDFTIATSVSDGSGGLITGVKAMTGVPVNDLPVLANNALTISEGGSVVISSSELSATDVDNASGSLSFTVTNVSGGQFELVASPGFAITSFTQAQVTGSAVRFVHDGGEAAPGYDVIVSDGALSDGPVAAKVSFTPQTVPGNVVEPPPVPGLPPVEPPLPEPNDPPVVVVSSVTSEPSATATSDASSTGLSAAGDEILPDANNTNIQELDNGSSSARSYNKASRETVDTISARIEAPLL